MTLRDFCADVGMSYSFMSSVEQGKTDLGLSYAVRLADLLNASICDMLKRPTHSQRIFRPSSRKAGSEDPTPRVPAGAKPRQRSGKD